jgi:phage gp36-like protein
MAYAAIADMISQFGLNTMIRMTAADGEELTQVNTTKANTALINVSAVIDSFLRKRYQVPVTAALPELNTAAVFLAAYDLAFGGDTEPTEPMRLKQKQLMEWLGSIRDGKTVLSGAVPSGTESFAMVQDRGFATFADDGDATGANVFSGPSQPPGFYEGGGW